jgi:hypothetical protein
MAAPVLAFPVCIHCSRARVRQAISSLLSSAKRVLPQKQRQLLAKAEKQAAVAASRAARKEAAGAQAATAAVRLLHATQSCELLSVHFVPPHIQLPRAHLAVGSKSSQQSAQGPVHEEGHLSWLLALHSCG